MEYHVEIYRPGSCDTESRLKAFTSATPFLPIRSGDLINSGTRDSEWPQLRVVNVEHSITESSRGIDPSGAIVHRIAFYTESVIDAVEARSKSSCGVPPARP
jgi:hypothetical protein